MPKQGLPERILDDKLAKDLAVKASEVYETVAQNEKLLKSYKTDITSACEGFREGLAKEGDYIGLVRIVPETGSPVRVEFRVDGNTALPLSDESVLKGLFGTAYPSLYLRIKGVSGITDPDKVIKDLGTDAWKHLELRVKRNHDDDVIAKTDAITVEEGLVPTENFLNELSELKATLKPEAKDYLNPYLKGALKPFVNIGGRGAKS